MINEPRILALDTQAEIKREFERIGVDPVGIKLMANKVLQLNIAVRGISAPAALILKQEMLGLGGDCANHRLVIKNEIDEVEAILMGSLKVFQQLLPKLKQQPFGLERLAEKLKRLIELTERPNSLEIKLRDKILNLSTRTHLMGILNVTPDSFSDGGKFLTVEKAVKHGIRLAEEGADIIDVGAESTRPGSGPISKDEELSRLIPVIEKLKQEINVPISVDTYKAAVAEAAIQSGADIINDISGLHFDGTMKEIAAKYGTPVVMMHIKGEPKNMQTNPQYENLLGEIFNYLAESKQMALEAGIKSHQIILDPGIGFGKQLNHNYEILKRLSEFKSLGCPILIGPSRKSFIGNVLNLSPEQRLEGTAAAVAIGIQNGADVVRVHDVKEMKRVCEITDRLVGKVQVL